MAGLFLVLKLIYMLNLSDLLLLKNRAGFSVRYNKQIRDFLGTVEGTVEQIFISFFKFFGFWLQKSDKAKVLEIQ